MVMYCCVPQCKSYHKTGVKFHQFPKDKKILKQWIHRLKMGKTISKSMVVCGYHFDSNDYVVSLAGENSYAMFTCSHSFHGVMILGRVLSLLKKGTVPSLNLPKTSLEMKRLMTKVERKPRPNNRRNLREVVIPEVDVLDDPMTSNDALQEEMGALFNDNFVSDELNATTSQQKCCCSCHIPKNVEDKSTIVGKVHVLSKQC